VDGSQSANGRKNCFVVRVCFKNPKRTDFLGDLIGWADKKTHEIEISY